MKAIMLICALALASCSTTTEDREAYRETGVLLALTAIDVIKDIGVIPEEIDSTVLKVAKGACTLLRAGGPVVVLAINTRVAEHNADQIAEDQTDLVTVEEYLATLDAVCDVIEAILEPGEMV